MKVQIPEQLKAEVPQSAWGKVLTATPVVMTVLATMLAGLASSEMTRAQYDRALAAQQQSKAGDQWSFFQAKRLRGALQRNSVDLLQSTTELHPFVPDAFKAGFLKLLDAAPVDPALNKTELRSLLDSPAGAQALDSLRQGRLPSAAPAPSLDPKFKQATEAVESSRSEAELNALLADIKDQELEDALHGARDAVVALDDATKPVNQAIDQLENALALASAADAASPAGASLTRDLIAARLRYTATRYEAEARLNQSIANLYELQVRKSNISAARHHARSQRFFFGMLAAQAAVIIATFAIAARKRNFLWTLAAFVGFAAVALAIYVYLWV